MKQFREKLKNLKTQTEIFLPNASIKLLRRLSICSQAIVTYTRPTTLSKRRKRGRQKLNWILKHLKNLKRQTLIFLQNASIKLLRRHQSCSWAKFTGTLFSGAAAFSAGGGGGRTPYTVSPKIQGRRGRFRCYLLSSLLGHGTKFFEDQARAKLV